MTGSKRGTGGCLGAASRRSIAATSTWLFLRVGGPLKGAYRAPLKGLGVDIGQV